MVERFGDGSLKWINLQEPTQEEIQEVMNDYAIPPGLMSDFSTPVPRNSVHSDGKAVKITFNFPIVKRTDINHPHEIKCIVTKKALITAHYEDIEAIDRFKKEFEVIATLHKTSKKASGAHIFLSLMDELYESTMSKLDYVEAKLLDIETEIFNEHEKKMVFEISKVSKRLITFKQVLRFHDSMLRDLKPLFVENFGKEFGLKIDNLHTHYYDIIRRTTAIFETLEELRNTNTALLTTKQNEIMKILTIMAFITFPLTLLTSLFGMNTQTTPIVGQDGDFWVIIGMMAVATILFFSYFKYKKWI